MKADRIRKELEAPVRPTPRSAIWCQKLLLMSLQVSIDIIQFNSPINFFLKMMIQQAGPFKRYR